MYRRMEWTDPYTKCTFDFVCCDKKDGSVELYMNGMPVETWQEENKKAHRFSLPGGYIGEIVYDDKGEIGMFARYENMIEQFHDVVPPYIGAERSVENMFKLAQFPPIAGLSMKEFYALKSLCTDSVNQAKPIRFPKEEIFLNMTGRDCTGLTYDDITKPGSGFVKVTLNHDTWNYDPLEANVRPGDNVLIYQKDMFGKESFVPIYDVTTATQFYVHSAVSRIFGDGARPYVIEGRNAVYITENITEELDKAKQLMEQSGVSSEDLSQIINSSTTFHEFSAISNMLRSSFEITDYVLERLSYGGSVSNVLEQISKREEQDMDTKEIDRGN